MCRSISSIRPGSSSSSPMASERTPRRSSARRVEGDLHRLLDRAAKDGDAVGRPGVLQVVHEYEDRPAMHRHTGRASPMALSKPSRRARTAPVVRVLLDQAGSDGDAGQPVRVACSGPATKPSSDIVKRQSTFAAAVCGPSVVHSPPPAYCLRFAIGRSDASGHLMVDCNQLGREEEGRAAKRGRGVRSTPRSRRSGTAGACWCCAT